MASTAQRISSIPAPLAFSHALNRFWRMPWKETFVKLYSGHIRVAKKYCDFSLRPLFPRM
ncbi:hypothetical protein [Olegusella massiliensis]|uniref:hypothetical protein n=1 Tax=Olegusella massiliensis TaxID=1776381 RepID=UPI0008399028|nr:hypothetical protein [Olegusella massiliensis]